MTRRSSRTSGRRSEADAAAERYAERAEELRRRLQEASPPDSEEALLLLADYGDACRFAGRIEESETTFQALLEQAQAQDHPRLRCLARSGLGNAHSARSRWDAAIEVLRPALEDATAAGDRVLRARAECILASALFNRGEYEASAGLLEGALRTAREYEVPKLQVPALISLGVVALARGEDAAAAAQLEDGLRLAERHRDLHWAGMGRSYLAMHAHLGGDLERAAAHYAESLEELEALGLRRALGIGRLARGLLELHRGQWGEAEETLRRADEQLAVTCPDHGPVIHSALALSALATGRAAAARQRIAHARSLCAPSTPASFLGIVARAEALVAGEVPGEPEPASIEGRLFARALRRVADEERAPSLVVDAEAHRARLLPRGELVDLSRRANLRQILEALLRAHAEDPGGGVEDESLIAAGWPGEKIEARSARVRLQTAISTLRRLGLASCLERSGEGYRLHRELVVRVVSRDSGDLAPREDA